MLAMCWSTPCGVCQQREHRRTCSTKNVLNHLAEAQRLAHAHMVFKFWEVQTLRHALRTTHAHAHAAAAEQRQREEVVTTDTRRDRDDAIKEMQERHAREMQTMTRTVEAHQRRTAEGRQQLLVEIDALRREVVRLCLCLPQLLGVQFQSCTRALSTHLTAHSRRRKGI